MDEIGVRDIYNSTFHAYIDKVHVKPVIFVVHLAITCNLCALVTIIKAQSFNSVYSTLCSRFWMLNGARCFERIEKNCVWNLVLKLQRSSLLIYVAGLEV